MLVFKKKSGKKKVLYNKTENGELKNVSSSDGKCYLLKVDFNRKLSDLIPLMIRVAVMITFDEQGMARYGFYFSSRSIIIKGNGKVMTDDSSLYGMGLTNDASVSVNCDKSDKGPCQQTSVNIENNYDYQVFRQSLLTGCYSKATELKIASNVRILLLDKCLQIGCSFNS